MDYFESFIDGIKGGNFLNILLGFISLLIIIVSVFAFFVSIYLSISYFKYNRKKNSAGMTGKEVARKILDDNGLENIKVSKFGSFLFGNSYSHYNKKVRLRRLICDKNSITSMAMATEKSALALLDKENDPDMKKRIKLIPIIFFGPFMFVPLIIIGVILDIIIFNSIGLISLLTTVFGLLIYVYSFVLSVKVLKTEIKAQERAIKIMEESNLASEEEIVMMKDLYRLYNIEYINDMVIALLELIYYIIKIIISVKSDQN